MLGLSSSNNRVFVYEVAGLHQTDLNNNYQIRNSSNAFIQVPYHRMNDEMQRINRLGGKIIAIQPLAEHLT
jgi:phycocyanin-associated, rod